MLNKLFVRSVLALVCIAALLPAFASTAQEQKKSFSLPDAYEQVSVLSSALAPTPTCQTGDYTVEYNLPADSFEDISATGIDLGLALDTYFAVPLPFTFSYYCGSYTTIYVNDSGVVNFTDEDQTYINNCLPTSLATQPTFIAPFWDDLDPANGKVYAEVRGTAPDRRMIIQWEGVTQWLGAAGSGVSFQVVLFETTDKILFQYRDVTFAGSGDEGSSATVGIQKDAETAIEISCNTPLLYAGMSILFSPHEVSTSCATAGYSYDNMVSYSFEDISTGSGTDLELGDNETRDISFPFPFEYYCSTYQHAVVGSNGYLTFTTSVNDPINSCIPTTDFTNLVAPFWDDLDPGSAGAVYYETRGSVPNRRLIVQWNDMPYNGIAGDATFQVILYEASNTILFQYKDVDFGDAAHDGGASATVGVQQDSAYGIEYSCDTESLTDKMAILISPYTEVSAPGGGPQIGLDYDCHREGVWVAGVISGSLYMLDPAGVIVKTIPMAGKLIGSSGHTDDVSVLVNGNLLLTQWNGDSAANIDDNIVEFDPDTETVVNYWPLDGTWNTSTDGTSIDEVVGVEMVVEPFGRAYVTSSANQFIYEVRLNPGSPGTWSTVAVHSPPYMTGATTGVDKTACYEDTPITGFAVADWGSTVVNFYTNDLTLNSNFDAQHGVSMYNTGLTIVPGDPAKLWVTDFTSGKIGIFDTQQKCTMHCGQFPWHEIIGAISQGSKQYP